VLNGRERRRFKRLARLRRSSWFAGGLPPAEWFAGRRRCPDPSGHGTGSAASGDLLARKLNLAPVSADLCH
jgi:hypothetical protein